MLLSTESSASPVCAFRIIFNAPDWCDGEEGPMHTKSKQQGGPPRFDHHCTSVKDGRLVPFSLTERSIWLGYYS